MATEDNVKALTEITGLKEDQATNLLTAYNGNLEGAINAFFENPEGILNPEPAVVIDDDDSGGGGGGGSGPSAASAGRSSFLDNDDNVRAPIPRKTEILLPQVETNRARLGKRRSAIITEVPFRNFELEGRIQEQMLMQQQGQGPSAKKITRLEGLFMPPFDILFSGGFDLAQRHGRSLDRWLLVNLQDDLNFSCQTLNRDLWSDAHLKAFMRRHLVFWQQSNKTTDGAKFKAFYKVTSEPYIGMIDPRTGEEVRNFSSVDLTSPKQFLDTLKSFLLENKSPHGKEVNVNQEYQLGMAAPSTSAWNGPKGSSATSTSTSTSAGSGTSKQSSASSSRNRAWVTVLDDDDEEEDDFQEITDSESDSEDNSRPSASKTGGSSIQPKAGPSAAASAPSMPLLSKEGEETGKPISNKRSAEGSNNNKESPAAPEQEPWEREEKVPKPTVEVLSSDSEASLEPDQKTRILLKMPGNVTERIFFRSSRTLERAMAKLRQKYENHFPNSVGGGVRFFCQAIKPDLSSLDPGKTLLELNIHPNAVIHVTTDD